MSKSRLAGKFWHSAILNILKLAFAVLFVGLSVETGSAYALLKEFEPATHSQIKLLVEKGILTKGEASGTKILDAPPLVFYRVVTSKTCKLHLCKGIIAVPAEQGIFYVHVFIPEFFFVPDFFVEGEKGRNFLFVDDETCAEVSLSYEKPGQLNIRKVVLGDECVEEK